MRRNISQTWLGPSGSLFFLFLAALTADMVWDDFRYQETSSGLGLPRWWYTAWVPALSLAIALRAALVLRRMLGPK